MLDWVVKNAALRTQSLAEMWKNRFCPTIESQKKFEVSLVISVSSIAFFKEYVQPVFEVLTECDAPMGAYLVLPRYD